MNLVDDVPREYRLPSNRKDTTLTVADLGSDGLVWSLHDEREGKLNGGPARIENDVLVLSHVGGQRRDYEDEHGDYAELPVWTDTPYFKWENEEEAYDTTYAEPVDDERR